MRGGFVRWVRAHFFFCAQDGFWDEVNLFGMSGDSITERVREIAERVTAERHLELVHVEVAKGSGKGATIVRIFIDKPEGITHDDCAEVSLHIGTVLDVEDFISSAYTLEVSSPGLERGLYKLTDYQRFSGRQAKIRTNQAINNQRNFRGRLDGVEGEEIIFTDRTSGRVNIPFAAVAKANLEIDVEEEFRLARERELKQLAQVNNN